MRALRRLARPGADEVIVPAYTCYSVPASIVKAGLRPRLVDVDPDTLDYDRAALDAADTSRVLAIVATNLYGIPNDLPHLVAFGRARGVFVVDDAAQAMGATSSGRPAGTWGDAGLFSLDKGKNVSAIDGGVLVTGDDRIAGALARGDRHARRPDARPPGRTRRQGARLRHAAAAAALLDAERDPAARARPDGLHHRVRHRAAGSRTRRARRRDAARARRLHGGPARQRRAHPRRHRTDARRARDPPVPADCKPAWLRLPLLVTVPGWRDKLVAELTAAGIGATTSYPAALADVPELAAVAGGDGAACAGSPHRGEPHPHAADAPVRVGGRHRHHRRRRAERRRRRSGARRHGSGDTMSRAPAARPRHRRRQAGAGPRPLRLGAARPARCAGACTAAPWSSCTTASSPTRTSTGPGRTRPSSSAAGPSSATWRRCAAISRCCRSPTSPTASNRDGPSSGRRAW